MLAQASVRAACPDGLIQLGQQLEVRGFHDLIEQDGGALIAGAAPAGLFFKVVARFATLGMAGNNPATGAAPAQPWCQACCGQRVRQGEVGIPQGGVVAQAAAQVENGGGQLFLPEMQPTQQ
jgi:hypothetical protein